MNKLVCIVGPTGTGKTKRAIELSKQQPSILVSADSRQVYRDMDIVTGKDHPKDVQIFGVDIVSPVEPCSVSVWYDAVIPHMCQAWDTGKQVIVVGGTGLYVKALTEGIPTMNVPINPSLRDKLADFTVSALQVELKNLSQVKFNSLNHSDQNNPRRLVRAIEVAKFLHAGRSDESLSSRASREISKDSEIIGLRYYDNSNYGSKIRERVLSRLELGAIEETKQLLSQYDRDLKSMSAIGYKSIINYLEGKVTKDQMISTWISEEVAYAKRQLTWFRKQPVIWYDIDTYGITKN